MSISAQIVHAMPPALRVDTGEELRQAIAMLSGSNFVALDTEFMREKTYYAGLCLVQVATADACYILDPLTIADLKPFWEFLADRSRIKVVHSGRQDLEVISLAIAPPAAEGELPGAAGGIPGPLFDTQIAAALLGAPAQVGYATLVAQRLGHTLAKAHTRTDWSRRPLSAEQVEYAADDVRFLVPLYRDLESALVERGRLPWQAEEALEMEDPALYRIEPIDAWRRLKGLDRMRADQRAVAKRLAEWRELRAMRKNKPRGWILADDQLRAIAERLPNSRIELETIEGLSANFLRKRSEEIIALIAEARANTAAESATPTPPRPDPQQTAKVTRLLSVVREVGQMAQIAPELLATRRDVEQLVFAGRSDHLTRGWRAEVIGARLVELAAN